MTAAIGALKTWVQHHVSSRLRLKGMAGVQASCKLATVRGSQCRDETVPTMLAGSWRGDGARFQTAHLTSHHPAAEDPKKATAIRRGETSADAEMRSSPTVRCCAELYVMASVSIMRSTASWPVVQLEASRRRHSPFLFRTIIYWLAWLRLVDCGWRACSGAR